MSSSPQSEAPFLPTSIYLSGDVDLQYILEKEHIDVANCVNSRELAFYDLVENQTGQQWFLTGSSQRKRFGYRKCFQATTVGAVTTIAHGITDIALCRVTHLYGTFQDTPFTIAVPIPQGGAVPVSLAIGPANITINDATAAYVGFLAYITVEFVRDR